MTTSGPGDLFRSRAERVAALSIGIYFAAFIIYAIGAQRGLVADGANDVVNIATKHNFTFEEPGRRAAEILFQWPAVLAVWLGGGEADENEVVAARRMEMRHKREVLGAPGRCRLRARI